MPSPLEILTSLPDQEVRELKKTYRTKLADSLQAGRRYNGSETEYENLLQTLIDLENWLARNFSSNDEKRLSSANEKEVNNIFHRPQTARTITDILDFTSKRFADFVEKISSGEEMSALLQRLKILHAPLNGVILPPADLPVVKGDGNGQWEKVRMIPRLEELIVFLNRHNIYTDDIIICSGSLDSDQMRESTYYIVEIPRINSQIMVCNQLGEATFVIDGIFDRQTLLNTTKNELQQKYPDNVTKIIYRDRASWEEKLEEALFKEKSNQPTRLLPKQKIEVSTFEAARREIRAAYSPEQWLAMSNNQKRDLRLGARKYTAICRLFGIVSKDCFARYYQAEIAGAVFGEDNPSVRDVLKTARQNRKKELELGEDLQKWKMEIRKHFEVGKWTAMTAKEKSKFNFYGKSICDLAKMWDIIESSHGDNRTTVLELALIFFAEDMAPDRITALQDKIAAIRTSARRIHKQREGLKRICTTKLDDTELRQSLIDRIKTDYTPTEWLAMETAQKRALMVDGLAYTAITGVILGIVPENTFRGDRHIELGAAIFGEEQTEIAALMPEIIANREKENELGTDPEKWKAEILKHYTFEQWMGIAPSKRASFSFFGKSLHMLAAIFMIEMDASPVVTKEFLELTLFIFDVKIDIGQRQKIEQKILALSERRKAGISLGTRKRGLKICDEPGEKTDWIEAVRAKISSKEFAEATSEELNKIRIKSFTLIPIAKYLGVIKENYLDRKSLLTLGEIVFGKEDPYIKIAVKELKRAEDPKKLAAVLRKKFTAEEWASMDVKKKRGFSYAGLGPGGIAAIFGVKGDPVSYHEIHLKTGVAIFPAEEVEKHIAPKLKEFEKQSELGEDTVMWQAEIKSRYTEDQWLALDGKARRTVFIHGRGMSFLGRIFGVKDNVLSSKKAFAELAERIFMPFAEIQKTQQE